MHSMAVAERESEREKAKMPDNWYGLRSAKLCQGVCAHLQRRSYQNTCKSGVNSLGVHF